MADAPARQRTLGPWEATPAHVRAVVLAACAALVAVVGRRPDLVVLAAPLVVAAVWGQATRPRTPVTAFADLPDPVVREGQPTTLVVEVSTDVPDAEGTVVLGRTDWVERSPAVGVAPLREGRAVLGVRPTRWGRRPPGGVAVALSSPWAAYRAGPAVLPTGEMTALPVPVAFDARAPQPHPRGVVGQHRSTRPGSGSEFSTIRPFHPGDRLRRIHWPVSLRTGSLHVTSTYADESAELVLLLDAFSDLGPREGIDGRPTSLDVTVRAAGAIAEHVLRTGDRLTLRTVGAAGVPPLGTGSGTSHLRRVLEALTYVSPATERRDDGRRAVNGLAPGSVALVLSPLIEPRMAELAHTLAARGMTTVVVDTFPEHLVDAGGERFTALAWRIRLLERDVQVTSLAARGVPVVPWRGPGSLDVVLRDIARRRAAPRRVRR